MCDVHASQTPGLSLSHSVIWSLSHLVTQSQKMKFFKCTNPTIGNITITVISQSYLRHISDNISHISHPYLQHISNISQPHLKHISRIFQPYLTNIIGEYQPYIRYNSQISQPYLRHFSGVYQLYLTHI